MNDTFASRVEAETRSSGKVRILVWDAPVRVFHWLMVASFAGAWLTAESERWRLLHVTLGYTMLGLVVFRILWGLAGTRYSRFASFVRSPVAALQYLASLVKGRPERYVGHNPAGAMAILAMLLMTCAVGASGWAAYTGTGGEWFEELHEGMANAMLALVIVHVVAVVANSLLHRENLIGAMVTGYKSGRVGEGIGCAHRVIAALVIAAAGIWWWTQWHAAPPTQAPQATSSSAGHAAPARANGGDRDGD